LGGSRTRRAREWVRHTLGRGTRRQRQAGGQVEETVAFEQELGAIDEARRVVAGERVVRREARLAAHGAERRGQVALDAFDAYDEAVAALEPRALRRGHEHARVRRVADEQARDRR